jgi:predicted RNase H-like nuclease (RuvC/YqgF family)
LTKLQTENEHLKESVHEGNLLVNKLKEEITLGAGLRRSKIPAKVNPDNNEEVQAETIKSLKKELAESNKTVDELKHKLYLQSEENKTLKGTLARELGEGVTVEQAVEGNWRGRAQQILMLKAKIKKLEASQGQSSVGPSGSTIGSAATGMGGGGTKMTGFHGHGGRGGDVDAKAETVISDMEDSRKRAIETITAEYEGLIVQKKELENKVNSQKARIKNLESDISQSKMEMQVVLEKTRSDDELVDLLKSEVQRLKENLATVLTKQKKDAMNEGPKNLRVERGGGLRDDRAGFGLSDNDVIASLRQDLARLERLNRNQAEQLQTQDKIIKELRSQNQPY